MANVKLLRRNAVWIESLCETVDSDDTWVQTVLITLAKESHPYRGVSIIIHR